MKIVSYERTLCPHCNFELIRTLSTWTNKEPATMRLHECQRCRTRFISKDTFVKPKGDAMD